MTRARNVSQSRKRHKKVLKLAKGYYGAKSRTYRAAHEQVMHSLAYAYRDRRTKKRQFRRLWITRINAAAKLNGLSYSQFIRGLKLSQMNLDRKILSDLAVSDPDTFSKLTEVAKQKLSS